MAESIKKFIIKDAHGGTKESGSFSVVGEVHVNIVPGYGEPYAESIYEDGILTITIHNIEGNGITEITTDSQEGDEAINTVTIKTNANPEGVTLEVRNGSRGNGIASSSEVLSPDDGGTNTHTITDTDGNEHVFHTNNGHKGDKGDQGDSAVYDPSSPDAPDFVMANITGQSTTKAMTQKAVTDELDKKPSLDDNEYSDLDISDEHGFILARFSEGHFRTKNFDSRFVGDSGDNADLNITDESGKVLAKFYNGHIRTKSFDSAQVNIFRPYQRVTRFSYSVDCNPTIKKDFATPTELSSYTQKMLYIDNAVLYLPTAYSVNGTPTKLIIYCKHGASEINYGGDPIMDSSDKNIFRYLLSLGYAILGADGVPDAFASAKGICERVVGNYIAVQSIRKAYDYVKKWYNIEKHGAYIYGYSQGGHYAQNVIDLSGINIIAAAEVSPVCSMRYHQWDLNATGTIGGVSWTKLARLNVARLFGFPTVTTNQELLDLAFDEAKVQGYDPWTRNVDNPYEGFAQGSTYGNNLWKLPNGTSLSDITMTKSLKCPLKIWCAENDNAVGSDVMKVFVQAAKNSGCVADMHLYSSGAHSIQTAQTAISTFTENGDTCNLYPLAYEIALWYGQFGGYDIK